jgi:hypothetical protein
MIRTSSIPTLLGQLPILDLRLIITERPQKVTNKIITKSGYKILYKHLFEANTAHRVVYKNLGEPWPWLYQTCHSEEIQLGKVEKRNTRKWANHQNPVLSTFSLPSE